MVNLQKDFAFANGGLWALVSMTIFTEMFYLGAFLIFTWVISNLIIVFIANHFGAYDN